MIFVSINYRLGTYGFLAGTTAEKHMTPNAGLWDQRAAFQWVQDHIHLVGGDKTQVTAMGESAGAGSIMHHLVAKGGKQDPLFKRAILQSPAYQLTWDRKGPKVQGVFERLAELAGCSTKTKKEEEEVVKCLRGLDASKLAKAHRDLNAQQPPGVGAVGPTPDGDFIRQMPQLELAQGNFWKGVESVVLSHVKDEAGLFVTGAVRTDKQFGELLDSAWPASARTAGVCKKVEEFYPSPAAAVKGGYASGVGKRRYGSQTERVTAFTRDALFTCNVRCKFWFILS